MPTPPESATAAPARRLHLLQPRCLLVLLVALGILALLRFPGGLGALGVTYPERWFLDSYAILAANDAVTAGEDPYAANSLDVLGRRHVYSDWWLALRHAGLTRADNFLFGAGCGLAFLMVALAGARPRTRREAWILAATLLSPPVLLALNRANNDLVVFALAGTPLLGLRGSELRRPAVVLALALLAATGLKYYPLAAGAAIVLLGRPARRAALIGGLTLAAGLAILWTERAALVRGTFTPPDSVYLFGAPVIWRGLGLGYTAVLVLSTLVIGIGGWVLAARGLTAGLAEDRDDEPAERWAFTAGALILTGCFLAGTSFAYRWIYAVWLVPWLLHRRGAGATAARLACGLLLISLWQDALYCLVLNFGLRRIPPGLDDVWRTLSHTTNWILVWLLAGWLMDAARRAALEWRRGRAGG